MKSLKGVALFVGGTAVGFVCGGAFLVKKALESEDVVDAVSTMLVKKITTALYGDDVRVSRRPGRVSYRSYYGSRREYHCIDDIIYDSRETAEKVLSELNKIIESYGFASVADLLDLAGLPSNYSDNLMGWVDAKETEIAMVRNGYILKLPKAMPID